MVGPDPTCWIYIGGIGDDHSSRRDSNPGLPLAKRMRYHYTTRARVVKIEKNFDYKIDSNYPRRKVTRGR